MSLLPLQAPHPPQDPARPLPPTSTPKASLLSEPSTLSFGNVAEKGSSSVEAPSSSANSPSLPANAPSSSSSVHAPSSSANSVLPVGETRAGDALSFEAQTARIPGISEAQPLRVAETPPPTARASETPPQAAASGHALGGTASGAASSASSASSALPALGSLPPMPMGSLSSPSFTNLPPFPSLSSPNAPLSRGSGVFSAASSPALSYAEDGSNTPLPPWQSRAPSAASPQKVSSHGHLVQVSHPEDPPTPSPFLKLANPDVPHATSASSDSLDALFETQPSSRPKASRWRAVHLFGGLGGIFVLLSIGFFWFGRSTKPPTPPVYSLFLNSNPQGAEVQMDGLSKGTTPLRLEAKQGQELALTLKVDGFMERSYTWIAKKSETQSIVLRKLYRLSLKTNPSGASVFLDEKLLGTTPYVLSLPEGKVVQIRLVRKGHITRNISWKAQRTEEQMVYLAPDVFD